MNKQELINSLDLFTLEYIKTLLWTETDNSNEQGGDSLDKNYSIKDFNLNSLLKIQAECIDFQNGWEHLLGQAGSLDQNAHDFCLTRNCHGTGFWDRGYGEIGELLTKACKEYSPMNVYIGDDGELHI